MSGENITELKVALSLDTSKLDKELKGVEKKMAKTGNTRDSKSVRDQTSALASRIRAVNKYNKDAQLIRDTVNGKPGSPEFTRNELAMRGKTHALARSKEYSVRDRAEYDKMYWYDKEIKAAGARNDLAKSGSNAVYASFAETMKRVTDDQANTWLKERVRQELGNRPYAEIGNKVKPITDAEANRWELQRTIAESNAHARSKMADKGKEQLEKAEQNLKQKNEELKAQKQEKESEEKKQKLKDEIAKRSQNKESEKRKQEEEKKAQKAEERKEKRKQALSSVKEKFSKNLGKNSKSQRDLSRKAGMDDSRATLNPITNIANGYKKAAGAVGVFTKKLKGILLYRTIRALLMSITRGIKEGIKNLYEYSRVIGTDFKKSMDSLSTSALLVKNSVAAMIAPLINQLAPVIERLTDAFSYLTNSIGLFYAKMTNQKAFSWAIRSFKEFNKASRQLLGFDEINKLNGNNEDYAGMFKEVSTAVEEGSLEAQIKSSLENMDFYYAGRLMAEKIMESFNEVDLAGLGSSLGVKFMSIIDMAAGFVGNFDFRGMAKSVAGFFNNAISNVDWTNLGAYVTAKVTAGYDMLIGFVQGLDVKGIANAGSDILVGAFDYIVTWLKGTDWYELGNEMYQKFKDLITNIKYGELARSFVAMLGTAISAVISAGWGALSSAAKDLSNWWNKQLETAGGDAGKAFCEGLKSFFKSAGSFIKEIGQILANKLLEGIPEGLRSLVSSAASSVSSFVGKITARADGGFVDRGDLFIANERGPELVGSIGGKTAVTNQDQFVYAVANAMAPVIDAIYATGSANVNAIANMPTPSIKIGDKDIYNASQRGSRLVGNSLVQGV